MEAIEVPFITDDGIPLHKLTQDEQRGYTVGLTVDQANSIVQHSVRLSARIKMWSSERAEMRKSSRQFLRVPEGSSDEVKQEKMDGLAALHAAYTKREVDIQALKDTVYRLNDKGELVIPRMPKA
jgi:predicted secreted protein